MIETIGLLGGSGWAAGINLYLVTLMLGIAGRAGWADIPEVLTRLDVMVVAGILFVLEFFADKVPFLDSFWDAAHTLIRPLGAAAIGAVIAGDSQSIGAAVGGVVAGALALDAHTAKASTRLVVNTSPEPVSNAAISLFEDVGVALLVALAFSYPVITVVVVVLLVIAATVLTIWLWKLVRRAWRRMRARLSWSGPQL
ncbi:MAG TPA: DUF4126 domain-containing protein [Acidimicrobiia bacterium]|nr:DUF4126 domain-containing protein [Acidimicrobiia bacterium]